MACPAGTARTPNVLFVADPGQADGTRQEGGFVDFLGAAEEILHELHLRAHVGQLVEPHLTRADLLDLVVVDDLARHPDKLSPQPVDFLQAQVLQQRCEGVAFGFLHGRGPHHLAHHVATHGSQAAKVHFLAIHKEQHRRDAPAGISGSPTLRPRR